MCDFLVEMSPQYARDQSGGDLYVALQAVVLASNGQRARHETKDRARGARSDAPVWFHESNKWLTKAIWVMNFRYCTRI